MVPFSFDKQYVVSNVWLFFLFLFYDFYIQLLHGITLIAELTLLESQTMHKIILFFFFLMKKRLGLNKEVQFY